MKVGYLMEILATLDSEEEVGMIYYDRDGEYMWWAIDRVERFSPYDENSPLTLVVW